jgi:hypothetical protein
MERSCRLSIIIRKGNRWHYEKDEENLEIECSARGEDLPMDIRIIVHADRQLIILLSVMPFIAPDTKRLDVAIATSIVNNKLVDGSFDYDVTSGHMVFRMTSSFIESEIDSEVFTYMLMVSFHTIDEYNDKFFMLGKGMLSINQFLEEN